MPSTGECYACELAAGVEVIGVGANPNRLESRGGRGNRGPALALFGFFVTVFLETRGDVMDENKPTECDGGGIRNTFILFK
jgi:hypothetical protein